MIKKMAEQKLYQRVRSFAKSTLSRYLPRLVLRHGVFVKVPADVKSIRSLSCNGDGQTIPPCPSREASMQFPGSFHCGACGCGDRKGVLVAGDVPPYGKLDYPFLNCPLQMPGFSNYEPGTEAGEDARKRTIEEYYGVAFLTEEAERQRAAARPQNILARLQKLAQ